MPTLPRVRPVARRALAAQSDERLVKLLREGHDAAFDEIVGRYQAPLVSFAAAFIPYHRAEDVVQASLLKAHKALLADDRAVALRAWLFTIVRNGALNAIRDEPDWQELDPTYDGVPQPPAIAEQNEELQRLVVAICALPEAQRRALVGRELEGEGHAELATELGTTATAVRGLIFRARTALRDSLGALIPLPVIRMLLSQGSAAGTGAGAGAGAGAGLGLGAVGLGGGAKLAATISAAALIVGGGIALEKRVGNRDSGGPEVAKAAASGSGSGSASATGRTAAAESDPVETSSGGGDGGAEPGSKGEGGSGDARPGDSGSSGPGSGGSGSGSSGDSGSGHQSGHEPGDDGSSGPGPGPIPEADDDGAHSGPGGGDDDFDDGNHSGSGSGGGGEIPEPEDDFDEDHSGSGGGGDIPEPDDSFDDDAEDDHSGPGGGDEPDDD